MINVYDVRQLSLDYGLNKCFVNLLLLYSYAASPVIVQGE